MEAPMILVVCGPTASGKTALSLSLASALGGEIVSADSMQIYRRMDIGTAKATLEERTTVTHHMLDIADPSEDYSVARYVADASNCCNDILSRGKLPILVGGTGLYIDSLLSGREFGAREEDPSLRTSLNAQYDACGGDAMLSLLRSFDPERAELLHPSDKKRIVRAIEVFRLTGETITEHDRRSRLIPPRYRAAFLIPGFHDRTLLYARIDERVDKMFSLGLVDEVRTLLSSGLSPACTAMQAIGYKEIVLFLEGACSLEDASEKIKLSSRRYAKRQLTWFQRYSNACRLYHDAPLSTPDSFLQEALDFSRIQLGL